MAGDVAPLNPCCTVWKDKNAKLVEGRACLRRAVKILEEQVDKIQADNVSLKKALEEERARVGTEGQEKEKQLALRVSLENEISGLKSVISSLREKGSVDIECQKNEVSSFRECVSEGEKEIGRLKELIEKEKLRADEEKKSASEARKRVKAEKEKADKERKIAITERKKAEDYRRRVEVLKKELDAKVSLENEVSALKSKILSLQQKGSAEAVDKSREVNLLQSRVCKAEEEINMLKKLLEEEKKRVACEKKKAEEESKNVAKAWKLVEAEKCKADEERKRAGIEGKKAEEYQIQLEKMKKKADKSESKLISLNLKLKEAMKRLEEEKNRAIEVRPYADSAMAKVEEQKKQAEVNRTKFLEGKSYAENVTPSKTEAESSALPDRKKKGEITKLKLLQKELKLQKMQIKNAKQVAKLEKSRNSILQQEVSRLKMDFVQILCRLDALDRCFSSSTEGIQRMEKGGNFANMQFSKLKRNIYGLEPFQTYHWNVSKPQNPSFLAMAGSDTIGEALQCNPPLLSQCEGKCAEFIPGIDSKLESLLGGSNQNLFQSSAINSSSASFSDGQLVGSQETGAFVTTADKFNEENFNALPTVSSISTEVTKVDHGENIAIVAETNVKSPRSNDVVGTGDGHTRKRRRMLDAMESVEFLHSEGKKFQLQMEDKLSALHSMLNGEIDKQLDSEEPNYVEAYMQGGSYTKLETFQKKGKVSHDQNVIMHLSSGIDNKPEMAEKIGEVIDANGDRQSSPASDNLMGNLSSGNECLSNPFGGDLENMDSFKKVANQDFMKLLELDDAADEEYYRRAMEVPMSPYLPEIEFSAGDEIFDTDKFEPLMDESFSKGMSNEKEDLMASHSFNVIEVTNLNKLKLNDFGTPCNELDHKDKDPINSFDTLGIGNGLCNAMESEKDSRMQAQDSRVEVEMSNIPTSVCESSKHAFETELNYANGSSPAYCVLFSNIIDNESISRVFCATRTCLACCSLDSQTEVVVQKTLRALKMEEKLLSKEKACTFLTILLQNFSMSTCGKFGSFTDGDFSTCLSSFDAQIHAAISGVEARSLFLEVCCLDELLCLIEDFLVNGKLMVCTDVPSGILSERHSALSILLDGVNINLFSRSASTGQLLAGSIILASLCAATDHIGFICEASFNLLQMNKFDTSLLLAMLHAFAYIGGEKFFSLKEYSLTMTVLKSVVRLHEGKNPLSASASSCLSSVDENRVEIHPCSGCPFSQDAVHADNIISMLLEILQSCALSGKIHQDLMELAYLSNLHVPCHNDKVMNASSHEEVHSSAVDVNYNVSCSLSKSMMSIAYSNSLMNGASCDLGDILSMVELLAYNMGWEWTCGKIIPELLKMLERPRGDNFAVAVVVLLGQLGRLGVATCGYEDKGVENLRCNLSDFLWRDAIRAALPVQVATVTALLVLLAINFENVVYGDLKLPEIASQSVFANSMRNWFSSLSKEQQRLSFSLLQSAD